MESLLLLGIVRFTFKGVIGILKRVYRFRRFKVARKALSTFFKVANPQKYCTAVVDVVVETELNAIDLLRKKQHVDFKSKGEKIHGAAEKVMGDAGILIGVAGNRQRKIAWLKNSYNFNDQVLCFKNMLQFIWYVDSIYKKPF